MLIPTMNGTEPAQAVLDGLRGRPQLVGGLSDAELAGAADTAATILKWFVTGVTWGADKCKQLQSMIASVPGGWSAITTALDAIPGTSFTPSGKTVHYWLLEANRQTCARLGFDLTQAPAAPAPTSTVDKTKLLTAIKANLTPIVQSLQPTSTSPATGQYPAGSIQWHSAKTGLWHVAVPRATAGLGIHAIEPGYLVPSGYTNGLGAIGAAAPYVETATSATAVPGVTIVSETDGQKQTGQLPLYKNWMFWAAVGGGVIVVGGIIALISRGSDRHARDQQFARGDYGFDDDDLGDDAIDAHSEEH